MTGAELRRARNRIALRKWRQAHPEKVREHSRNSNRRLTARVTIALQDAFGIRSPITLANMWLRGEIQIMRDGKQVNP